MSFLQVVGVTIQLVSIHRGVNRMNFSRYIQADRASAGLVSARNQILLLDIMNLFNTRMNNNRLKLENEMQRLINAPRHDTELPLW